MKIISKIKFHPLLYFFALLAIITGLFREFIIFMMIIFIHEIGHIFAGFICNVKLQKVIFMPFGGLTIFSMPLNIEVYKELFIATMGPVFQIISFLILINYLNSLSFYYYNIFILIFNLLPIYPLDGSKILNCFLCYILNYRNSFNITFYTSFLFIMLIIILTIINKINFGFLIIIIFIGYKSLKEYLNFPSIYNKFLFERYINKYNFKKVKYVSNIYFFYKGKRHIIRNGKNLITEKEILRKRFDFKRNVW